MSIARGGPYGVPGGQANSVLLLGVSSFGAQGTNAHALLSGTGMPDVVGAAGSVQPMPAWRAARCYAAPPAQQLLAACLLRKRSRGGAAVFDAHLWAPRLAYLWQYNLQGSAHLASAALLSMTASLLPLLGAMASGEDASSAASLADAALVAPAVLPPAAAAKVAPAHARVRLARGSGLVDVSFAAQKLLTARLAGVPAVLATQQVDLAPRSFAPSAGLRHRLLAGAGPARAVAGMLPADSMVAELAGLPASEASGYPVHPVLLDACMGQAAAAGSAWQGVPLTWVRSVAALLVGLQSPVGGVLVAAYRPADSWWAGSATLAAPGAAATAAALAGVVLGDQDKPPTSPGPSTALRAAEAADAAALAAEKEAAVGDGVPVDHPLLQVPEEERLLHLQAQVGAGGAAFSPLPLQALQLDDGGVLSGFSALRSTTDCCAGGALSSRCAWTSACFLGPGPTRPCR